MDCKYKDEPCGWDEEWWFDGDCTHCSEYKLYTIDYEGFEPEALERINKELGHILDSIGQF